jgi:hypothetical protein
MAGVAVPRPGEVVCVGERASVQFAGRRSFLFRVIRVHDWSTYERWAWLDGYQLNEAGDAVERRSIYVQPAGLWRPGGGGTRPSPSARSGPKATARCDRGPGFNQRPR